MGTKGTTPLQIKLNKLAYILLGVALLLALIVVASTGFVDVPMSLATYAIAWWALLPRPRVLLFDVRALTSSATFPPSSAVSILPASLIAVISLTLANGSRELAKRNALVRRMDAIEALAAITDICSDKVRSSPLSSRIVPLSTYQLASVPDRHPHRRQDGLQEGLGPGVFFLERVARRGQHRGRPDLHR